MAAEGLRSDGCRRGQYGLCSRRLGLSYELTCRRPCTRGHRSWVCLQAEVDSELASGAILRQRAAIYHVVLVLSAHEPLAVYVNGRMMPNLFLAANPLAEATMPLDVQWESWSRSLRAIVAPLIAADTAGVASTAAWDGSLHSLALFSRALTP